MSRVRYSKEQDDRLVSLRDCGYSPARIGKIIGRTTCSVAGRLRALGYDCEQVRPVLAEDVRANNVQRHADDKFRHALALAFRRKDHLPAAPRLAA